MMKPHKALRYGKEKEGQQDLHKFMLKRMAVHKGKFDIKFNNLRLYSSKESPFIRGINISISSYNNYKVQVTPPCHSKKLGNISLAGDFSLQIVLLYVTNVIYNGSKKVKESCSKWSDLKRCRLLSRV